MPFILFFNPVFISTGTSLFTYVGSCTFNVLTVLRMGLVPFLVPLHSLTLLCTVMPMYVSIIFYFFSVLQTFLKKIGLTIIIWVSDFVSFFYHYHPIICLRSLTNSSSGSGFVIMSAGWSMEAIFNILILFLLMQDRKW